MAKSDIPQGQDAYHRIIAEIRSGAMVPGDRLTEVDLAERFGISRTPVREAIRQLEADGLVTHTPRRGATIRTLGPAEISELYDMRAVLEGAAAQFAARAASEVELAELSEIHQAMTKTSDAEELYRLNQHFHAGLLDAARNRFLMKSVAAVTKTLLILGRSTMEEGDRASEALSEHAKILAALEARDPETAGNVMRAHIAAAHRARLRQLRDLREDREIADDA
ncbi:GntR family transcriptional regulator [Aestuariibius insulae]|uniref:GntR family transcriptional regulator n=1 Tax=Aestuariibius insulae TaxID=2058287 RepID=UPI00345E81BB